MPARSVSRTYSEIFDGSDITADEWEFLQAIAAYQKRWNRRYPSWREVLHVLRCLGYRKVADPEPRRPDRRARQTCVKAAEERTETRRPSEPAAIEASSRLEGSVAGDASQEVPMSSCSRPAQGPPPEPKARAAAGRRPVRPAVWPAAGGGTTTPPNSSATTARGCTPRSTPSRRKRRGTSRSCTEHRPGRTRAAPLPHTHPLCRLLDPPNPWLTPWELWYLTVVYLELTGNCLESLTQPPSFPSFQAVWGCVSCS